MCKNTPKKVEFDKKVKIAPLCTKVSVDLYRSLNQETHHVTTESWKPIFCLTPDCILPYADLFTRTKKKRRVHKICNIYFSAWPRIMKIGQIESRWNFIQEINIMIYYYIISFKFISIVYPAFHFRPSTRRFCFVQVYTKLSK